LEECKQALSVASGSYISGCSGRDDGACTASP
jgi:hypothetical protein